MRFLKTILVTKQELEKIQKIKNLYKVQNTKFKYKNG